MDAAHENTDAIVMTVRIDPPKWKDMSGGGYRLFVAETPRGEFAYGISFNGTAYHRGIDSSGRREETNHPDERAAKAAAELSYARHVTRDLNTLGNTCGCALPSLPDTSVVSELRRIFVEYAENCVEAKSYGGPTITPRFPLDEGSMRVFGLRLAALERALTSPSS